jgi:hypothetical protein
MQPIRIRDLETGELLVRHGATAEEILASHEPVRDEDGNIVLDENGEPEKGEKRFVRAGREPRDWVNPKGAADAAKQEPDNAEAQGPKGGRRQTRKRSQGEA